MTDPFLNLVRARAAHSRRRVGRAVQPVPAHPSPMVVKPGTGNGGHAHRAHSKFAASASERWLNCPGSVELSEGLPDRSSPWAEEGTRAHEVLEAMMLVTLAARLRTPADPQWYETVRRSSNEMLAHAKHAAAFIFGVADRNRDAEVMVETRIYLDFIDPEMFGTFDGAVIDHFGTLHVFDYKYGAGVFVTPKENLQMIFYGIGLAHRYLWNFKRVRLWIIQPRVRGYDGPLFWELSTGELKGYVETFRSGVRRVRSGPAAFSEGAHCHWCKAKTVCPLKREAKLEAAKAVFAVQPTLLGGSHEKSHSGVTVRR